MNDFLFCGIAALIGLVGALALQVLNLQQSQQIATQAKNLQKKKDYLDSIIKEWGTQRKDIQKQIWEFESKVADAEDKTETQYREFRNAAAEQLKDITKAIDNWDIQRNEIINTLCSTDQTKYMSPPFLTIMLIAVGAGMAAIFGYFEIITKGPGKATLTVNLLIEFLFVGAFWPLIWQRIFNPSAVQERVNTAVTKFGIDIAAPPTSAGSPVSATSAEGKK